MAYVYSVNVYRHSVAHKCAEWPPHHTDVCSLPLVCKFMLSASSLQLLCNVCHRLDSADGFCCGANGAVGLRLGHQPCPGALVTLSAALSSALISEMQACVQLSTNSASQYLLVLHSCSSERAAPLPPSQTLPFGALLQIQQMQQLKAQAASSATAKQQDQAEIRALTTRAEVS